MDGLKACSGEFVFLMDADMSHHPRYMADFIR
jgi:glycosyltransferase involved in cell wall biosynthesis